MHKAKVAAVPVVCYNGPHLLIRSRSPPYNAAHSMALQVDKQQHGRTHSNLQSGYGNQPAHNYSWTGDTLPYLARLVNTMCNSIEFTSHPTPHLLRSISNPHQDKVP